MKALRKITEKALNAVIALSAVMLASSMLIYAYNCFMRYAVRAPMSWPEEYCTYIVVLMVFFMQCRLEFKDESLCIGLLDNMMEKNPVLERLLFYLRGVISLIVFGILLNVGVSVAKQNFFYGSISPVLKFSMGMYFALVDVCLALVMVFWVVNIITRRFGKTEVAADE